jgi:hypothetical protein
MPYRRAAWTADDLLIQARAILPHRPSPTEALQAQENGSLLVDIRGDDQRHADGLIPAPSCCPATRSSGAATLPPRGGIPLSRAGRCVSSWSVTRDTSPAWPRRRYSSWAWPMPPILREDSPPGPQPACR